MSSDRNTTTLVVGAGVAGITAALDIANSGYQVVLVDRLPNIGGKMAQLSDTFPTLDCSQCMMTPRTAEVNAHPNIRMMMCSTVESIEGEPGAFKARVVRSPRYVDEKQCTACGDCAKVCPVRVPSEPDEGVTLRSAIYKPFPQAIPSAFVISKQGTAPCRDACPTGQRVQGYVALIHAGRYADAYRTIRLENPFPSICGRVCNHVCETACTRGDVDAPISIASLKRFVADWAFDHPDAVPEPEPVVTSESKRVAVIGSGPAGMTAALDLVRQGFPTTVFESLPVAGGMMRVGVPRHRLPPEIVQREIDAIVAQGVDLRLDSPVADAESLLSSGYDAVFVAVGAHRGIRLPLSGADGPGVLMATDFLRDSALDKAPAFHGRRVLVLGGGNVAVDSAQTALRLGAEWVGMTCVESRDTMPASAWEVEESKAEGIEIFPSRTFLAVERDGEQITGVRCEEISSFAFTPQGLKVEPIPGTEHVLPADLIIFAIGQRPDLSAVKGDALRTPRGLMAVDRDTLRTSNPAIFAGGDAVTGTTSIVEAIDAGHRAAVCISQYLRGEQVHFTDPRLPVYRPDERTIEQRLAAGVSREGRQEEVVLDPVERRRTFDEVHLGLTEEQAQREAARCLNCAGCAECLQCVAACQRGALDHSMGAQVEEIEIGAIIAATGYDLLSPERLPEYGGGRLPDVLTSLQFERLLASSGPTNGMPKRLSDGREPQNVVWLQCAGSREPAFSQSETSHRGVSYCSKMCCMITAKQVLLFRHRIPNGQATVFYMDIRAGGKGYEEFIQRAMEEAQALYIRGKASRVEQVGDRIRVFGVDTLAGRGVTVDADMVVLAAATLPSAGTQQAAEALGIPLTKEGFLQPIDRLLSPVETGLPGIFLCGAAAGPCDVPETSVAGSAAAAKALRLFAAWEHGEGGLEAAA
jgi:heterodisulfide reductase subunit A-like polyferredoxin